MKLPLVYILSNSILQVFIIFLDVITNKCRTYIDIQMIGGKPFDVESLLRDCVTKKKRPIHDTIQLYDQQQQQATDLSIGKERLQPGSYRFIAEIHIETLMYFPFQDEAGECSNSSTNSSSTSMNIMRSSIDAYRQHLFSAASTEAAKSFLLTMRNFAASTTSAPMITGNNSNIQMKKTKRRSRAAFSHAQVIELERRFAQQKYLSSTERAELATLLSVSLD